MILKKLHSISYSSMITKMHFPWKKKCCFLSSSSLFIISIIIYFLFKCNQRLRPSNQTGFTFISHKSWIHHTRKKFIWNKNSSSFFLNIFLKEKPFDLVYNFVYSFILFILTFSVEKKRKWKVLKEMQFKNHTRFTFQ